jgi:chorismate dehydratase
MQHGKGNRPPTGAGKKGEPVLKLRLAPEATPEELAHRFERERRAEEVQREDRLTQSLAPFRVGSVPYLNAVPLTRGIEEQVIYRPPSELAKMLLRDELDAALVSVAEVLLTGRYDLLNGVAVASLGEIRSAFLAYRRPLEEIREVYCDTASISTVNLMRVLLAERGLKPEFKPLPAWPMATLPDYFMLIGDHAIEYALGPREHELWDLGAAWHELTGLPFVYAAWALRRGLENQRLRQLLHEAHDFGLDTLDYIISSRTDFTLDFRKDYLGWHVHYHLGADEKRGIARFVELLRKHANVPVHDPHYLA